MRYCLRFSFDECKDNRLFLLHRIRFVLYNIRNVSSRNNF
nr:MAG TPA: hypothetical protein [Bacteriophage sp.]